MKKRYKVEKILYRYCMGTSYSYAIVDQFNHSIVKVGFLNEYDARLWYSQAGYSILELEY